MGLNGNHVNRVYLCYQRLEHSFCKRRITTFNNLNREHIKLSTFYATQVYNTNIVVAFQILASTRLLLAAGTRHLSEVKNQSEVLDPRSEYFDQRSRVRARIRTYEFVFECRTLEPRTLEAHTSAIEESYSHLSIGVEH